MRLENVLISLVYFR